MVFAIAGFDLNRPMRNWVSTDADVPRRYSHGKKDTRNSQVTSGVRR
jgi:hypothetical protein